MSIFPRGYKEIIYRQYLRRAKAIAYTPLKLRRCVYVKCMPVVKHTFGYHVIWRSVTNAERTIRERQKLIAGERVANKNDVYGVGFVEP